LISYRYALSLQIGPRKELESYNVVPWGGGRRGSSESSELARARDRERAGKGSPPSKGSIPGLGRVREVAGEGARRRPVAVAAASRAGVRPKLGWAGEAQVAALGSHS
jgi:hypothetical protein